MSHTKPYWHEASEEEVMALDGKVTWDDVCNRYSQPDWCTYPMALGGLRGCWSLTILETRKKISREYCKDCDCFKESV